MPRRRIELDNALTDSSPKADDPDGTGVRLFPHQKAALQAMLNLESCGGLTSRACPDQKLKTRIGVLGDKPGAGKSYVILAMALIGNSTSGEVGFHEYNISPHASVIKKDDRVFSPTNIIVIPHGLTKQWSEYLEFYMPPSSKWILINRRRQYTEVTEERLRSGYYRVIVVTTTMLPVLSVKLSSSSARLRVSRVFYDECDGIDVKSSSYINAAFYWFVSASFHNLLTPRGGTVRLPDGEELTVYGYYNTHLRNFFDPFQSVNENLVKQIAVFSDEDFVNASLQLPEPLVNTVLCKTPYSVRILHGNVRQTVIRALNAGDAETAVRQIGAYSDTESNIVSTVLDRYNREKRALEARLTYIDDYINTTQGQRDAERARCNQRIAELERSIKSISERVEQSVTCPICYEDFKNKTIVPCCQNSFCLLCITNWVNSRYGSSLCPMCKAPVNLNECLVCREGDDSSASSSQVEEYEIGGIKFVRKGEKIDNLKELLLSTGEERRFLIFSEYDYSLEQSIANMLRANNIQYGMLKRNVHTINRVVESFKSGSMRVLLINSAHYGCGMNLPEATDVVIMHKLTEGKSYKQVVGRAQRCRRRDRLNIWKFFNENECQDDASHQPSRPPTSYVSDEDSDSENF